MTEDWNALLYLRFERERTQPSRDLLASSPEHLRVLVGARNVGLIVAGACCTECAAVVGS